VGDGKISVLLTTEGTYPFHQGGVSTWCDILIKKLHHVDFTVYSVLTDPFITQKFDVAPYADLIKVPLWGTEEPDEHLDKRFSSTYLAKKRTTTDIVVKLFLPLFKNLINGILSIEKDSIRMGDILVQLYDLFQEYDYKVCFKSQETWDAYTHLVTAAVQSSIFQLSEPDVYSMVQSLGWIYRFFNILNTPVPKTTIAHSSAAAFCGIPCVISKLRYGTPFLLTEHGVYLREQYLSLSKRGYPSFLTTFLIRLIQTVVQLNYAFADQISPVCNYNTRWEKNLTDRHERIQVIYNGVDHLAFSRVKNIPHPRPTVVTVARIDPIKDIVTLLRAAKMVKSIHPDVEFLIYGSISVPEYYDQCLSLRTELDLDTTVVFKGHTTDLVAAYESGDIVAQSSISEAFPYSIIEAMLAGKAVVSTDVGGISEALGETGILIVPGDANRLAGGICKLIENPQYRTELAEEAQSRALSLFTLNRSLSEYLKTYIKLAIVGDANQPFGVMKTRCRVLDLDVRRQQVLAERAYAFLDIGEQELADQLFSEALQQSAHTALDDIIKMELAFLHSLQGDDTTAEMVWKDVRQLSIYRRKHKQRLLSERAYALHANGHVALGILALEKAIEFNPNSSATALFLLDLAHWHELTGNVEKSQQFMHRYRILERWLSA